MRISITRVLSTLTFVFIKLKLQATYHGPVVEIQALLENHIHIHSQCHSQRLPNFLFSSCRQKTVKHQPRPDSSTQRTNSPYIINSKYRIRWEYAKLLIELAGGSLTAAAYGPKTSVSAPVVQGGNDGVSSLTSRMGKERAITLAGDESKPPPQA